MINQKENTMSFYARTRELAMLNKHYLRESFECIVIYGRRRIGKTALISEFVRDKRVAFFSALESSAEKNLMELSEAIQKLVVPDGPRATYASFSEAFIAAFACAHDERTVLVIDEYPYLAASDPSVSSALQHAIDHHKDDSKLMIILCGSSTSFMEEQVLGNKSPLYGRRTAQLKLEPLTFADSREFFPDVDAKTAMELYALTGGVPRYLEELDPRMSVKDNIREAFLDPSCYLFEEPRNLLMQEVRSPASYSEVISAIAQGASRANEIATAAHVDSSRCAYYLKTLADLGLVAKEYPFGVEDSKRAIWEIRDSFFRFWYRFVPANWSILQAGMLDVGTERVMGQFPSYMGREYERVCEQWLWRQNGAALPFVMLESGRWWGTDRRSRQQEEIDIVGKGEDGQMLFCECKWRNETVGIEVLERLMWRSERFAARKRSYALFSLSGFSDSLVSEANAREDVLLVTLDDM